MDKALQEAIRRAGGLHALGRALGITFQAIQKWPYAPVRRVLEIERLAGVPRHKLRPDIYPSAEYRRKR